MRRACYGSAAAVLAMLLRAGAIRAQASDPVGVLPGGGVLRPHRQGGSEPYPVPQDTTYGVLDEMASRAAVIFVGTVRSVQWLGTKDAESDGVAGIVAVEFAVEDGVRGTTAGATYILREWAGLWRDAARYRVGQRRLMLLHAPGPAGLSSPVDGLDGAIPVIAGVTPQQGSDAAGLQADGAPALPSSRVDLRWIDARRLRTVTLTADPVARPGNQPAQPLASPPGMMTTVAQPESGSTPADLAVLAVTPMLAGKSASLADVVRRLRGVEAPHAAAQ